MDGIRPAELNFGWMMDGYQTDAAWRWRDNAWSGALGHQWLNVPQYAQIERRVLIPMTFTRNVRMKFLVDDTLVAASINGSPIGLSNGGTFQGAGYYTDPFVLVAGENVLSVTIRDYGVIGGFIAEIRQAETDGLLLGAGELDWKQP